MDFVFYDLETTGISTAFDQPLQFAAIRTDAEFNELERVNLRCRLAPHILPSPYALVVTGVTPEQLTDPSLPSLLEFAHEIADLTERWAPAIWTGYNSIRFDEEMLRQTFYQNLLPNVFATQFHGNTRLDMITAVYATYMRAPTVLAWPTKDTGEVTFKLDQLAPANGFTAHNAHDALGDVEATIHLARKIAAGNPALWAQLLAMAHKSEVQAKLESFAPLDMIARYGRGAPQRFTGCFCGYAASNGTQAAFFDLDAADPADLFEASDEALFAAVDASPQIIRTIATNKAPALFDAVAPSAEQQRRAALIAEAPEFRARVGKALAARSPEDPDAPTPPVEKQIFDGFYSDADKDRLAEFRHADWRQRQEIVAGLSDPRLRQLGRRLVAFYSPELLTAEEAAKFNAYLQDKWSQGADAKVEWTTLQKSEQVLSELEATGEANPATLAAIRDFILQWSTTAAGHPSGR
jgi:exodeoxyribonuclease-1